MKITTVLLTATFGLSVSSISSVARADGAANWVKHCATCHGKDGTGKTKMGAKLKIRDFTSAEVQTELTDAAIEKSINEGVKKDSKEVMKSFKGKLSSDEIKELVKVVKALKK